MIFPQGVRRSVDRLVYLSSTRPWKFSEAPITADFVNQFFWSKPATIIVMPWACHRCTAL
jgi:hypothetical protein